MARDIALALGYKDTDQAVRKHCKHAKPLISLDPSIRRGQQNQEVTLDPQTKVIPEGDVYRLIMRSKLPSATRFETWLFDKVLPSIRKTARYAHPQVNASITDILPATLRSLADTLSTLADAWEQQKVVAAITAPKPIPSFQIPPAPEAIFLTAWWDCIDTRDVTAKDLYQIITNQQCPMLLEAATTLFGTDWTSRRLGNALRKWSQQNLKGFLVLNLGKGKGGNIWRLEQAQ